MKTVNIGWKVIGAGLLLLTASCKSPGGGGGVDADPIARLSANGQAGPPPLTVELDASASTDPGGSIVSYQWDFETDGVIDETTTTPTITHIYTAVGTHTAQVRVLDNDGNSDSDTVTVRVLTGVWHTQALDSVGDVGRYTSAAIISGRPAIAYADMTAHRLKYVIAANDAGTAWGIPMTVAPSRRSGQHNALAEINGRPGIATVDDQAGRVLYVRSLDATGTTWDDPVPVGLPGTIDDTDLIELDGRPAIAFVDSAITNDGDPVFTRAFDTAGTDWDTGVLIDDTGEDVSALDLDIAAGVPAVGYVEELSRDLRFVQARDGRGDSWYLPTDAVATGAVGNMMSLAIVGGKPLMAYLDTSGADGDLLAVASDDTDGIAWDPPVIVDDTGDSEGQYNSIAVIGGRPAIAYYNLSQGRLEYVEANNAAGTSWGASLSVADGTAVGQFVSLVSVGGAPGISYYDGDMQDLKWSVLE